MVGAINDARAAEDYRFSSSPARSHERRVTTPLDRAMAAGWPSNQAWEVLNKAENPALVFET